MNPGCDSLKNRRLAASVAAMCGDRVSVPNEVCPVKILSINRLHKVPGHFLASVLDKNESNFIAQGLTQLLRVLLQMPRGTLFGSLTYSRNTVCDE